MCMRLHLCEAATDQSASVIIFVAKLVPVPGVHVLQDVQSSPVRPEPTEPAQQPAADAGARLWLMRCDENNP